MSKKSIILFVCHDKETVVNVLRKLKDANIIFVGDNEVDNDIRNIPNIIIARELPNNIEDEKKLLTFTAWYLIIKNDLFLDYDYICILENDVLFDSSFIDNLETEASKNESEIITFNHGKSCFSRDVSIDVFVDFLKIKQIDCDNMNSIINKKGWYPSTNHCLRREILKDFVDWYYPYCFYIKTKDPEKFSWYHERLFNVYLYNNDLTITKIIGLMHLSNKSHEKTFNNKFCKNLKLLNYI
jgi:hypothetical protein